MTLLFRIISIIFLLVSAGVDNAHGYLNLASPLPSFPFFRGNEIQSRNEKLDQITSSRRIEMSDQTSTQSQVSNSILSTPILSPWEAACLVRMDRWYTKSQTLKCPFMRRRLGDVLDTTEVLMKHTVIRPACWPLLGPPQAWRPAGRSKKMIEKYKGLSLEQIKTLLEGDWKTHNHKGYYVTGKLTAAIYRNDCQFTGPDPDMPIRGIRKYMGVAAHLFDQKDSGAELLSLEEIIQHPSSSSGRALLAHWQMHGILRLPWKPHLPVFQGTTTYFLDEEGLIEHHAETWNISAVRAFCQTLWPEMARRLWRTIPKDSKKVVNNY
jgi:hypothetical protein